MKIKKPVILGAVIFSVALLAFLSSGKLFAPKEYKETQFMMDTIIEITAYGQSAEPAVKKALSQIQTIADLTNQFAETSDVAKINAAAGLHPVAVNATLIQILKSANANSEKFGGALDVTVGALTNLWGVGRKGDFVPADDEITALLPLVNYRLIEIDEAKNTVFLPKPGMRIDLGAVAKEYAARQAAEVLRAEGITSALINAGGDIRVIGLRPDQKPWRIGVQDPRNPSGVSAKIAMTEWDSLETSGDYQRFFEKNGTRYSHILDPKTGKQPREVISVTVFSNSAYNNYMLATALFVLGAEKGRDFIKNFPGAEAMWITLENKIIITPGLKGKIETAVGGEGNFL